MVPLGTKEAIKKDITAGTKLIENGAINREEIKKGFTFLGRNLTVSFEYQIFVGKGYTKTEIYYINMKSKNAIKKGLLENGFEDSGKKIVV